MKSKPTWVVVLLAIAAAILAFATTFLNGCAVAVHGQLVSWGALADKEPPPIPHWAETLTPSEDCPLVQEHEQIPD